MDQKIAVVTGSTSGIGLGIAHCLAGKGCSVVLTGLGNEDELNSIIKDFQMKYQRRVDFVPSDFSDTDSTLQFCESVSKLYPDGIDILVNNAGIQYICPVVDYPLKKWSDMMTITVTAPFLLTKHFLPKMKEKGWGRIINMSSQMGLISAKDKAPYSAAKSALIGLTKGVAIECGESGVTCNAVCPGFVDAPMFQKQVQTKALEDGITYQQAQSKFLENTITKTVVDISEIAGMVEYLCSPLARNITGTSILIDCGNTAQ